MHIVLKRAAVWLPENFEDSNFIANASGIPQDVVEKKMGIIKKCRAPKDVHPSFMAVEAAKKALKDVDPSTIDLIIWTGSEYKDHPVWSAGIFVQQALNLKNAWAFDIAARCSSNVVGLKVAKDMMQSNPNINNVLLCGGHKTGDLVNYKDPNSRFLYNLSDGGSAMLVTKSDTNELSDSDNVLQSASIITDGAFSKDVIIDGGGTVNPARDGLRPEQTYLSVPDIIGMRERLEEKSLKNFVKVIKDASVASFDRPIDYLALLHMKKSAHDAIVERMELSPEQSIYLDHYGHFGAPDQVLSLGLAERRGLLKAGDGVVLASAGIGYTWSAMGLIWNNNCFDQSCLDKFEV